MDPTSDMSLPGYSLIDLDVDIRIVEKSKLSLFTTNIRLILIGIRT